MWWGGHGDDFFFLCRGAAGGGGGVALGIFVFFFCLPPPPDPSPPPPPPLFCSYTGARTADAFLAHIKATLKADGGFARVADLDVLAASFAADPSAAALKKLQAAAAKVSGDAAAHAATYAKVAAKGLEKGADWFGKEAARVDRLLASGSVGGGRVAELAAKLSVLGAFVEEEGKAADA